jgi:hypothetical protein
MNVSEIAKPVKTGSAKPEDLQLNREKDPEKCGL